MNFLLALFFFQSNLQLSYNWIHPTRHTSQTIQTYKDHKTINIQANRLVFHNFDELMEDADFVGIVESDKPFSEQQHKVTYNPDGFIQSFSTQTRVKVLNVFKGDKKKGDYFNLIEPSSIVQMNGNKYHFNIDDYIPISPNKPYIVFLKKNDYGELAVSNLNESIFPQEIITPNPQSRSVSDSTINVLDEAPQHQERTDIYKEIIKQGWTK